MMKKITGISLLIFSMGNLFAEFKDANEAAKAINYVFDNRGTNLSEANKQSSYYINVRDIQTLWDNLNIFINKIAGSDTDLTKPTSVVSMNTMSLINIIKILNNAQQIQDSKKEELINSLKKIPSNFSSAINALDKATFILPSKRNARTVLKLYINKINNFTNIILQQITTAATVPQIYKDDVYKSLGITKSSSVYNALGLPNGSSADNVKKAFRTLSIKWHPDRNNSAIAKDVFQLLNFSNNCIVNGGGTPGTKECRS